MSTKAAKYHSAYFGILPGRINRFFWMTATVDRVTSHTGLEYGASAGFWPATVQLLSTVSPPLKQQSKATLTFSVKRRGISLHACHTCAHNLIQSECGSQLRLLTVTHPRSLTAPTEPDPLSKFRPVLMVQLNKERIQTGLASDCNHLVKLTSLLTFYTLLILILFFYTELTVN